MRKLAIFLVLVLGTSIYGQKNRYKNDFEAYRNFITGGEFRCLYVDNPTYLQNCDTVTDFSSTSYGTISKDTTYYRSGTGSMRLIPNGTSGKGYMQTNLAFAAKDLTNTHAVVRIYIHEGSGDSSYTKLSSVRIWVKDGTNSDEYVLMSAYINVGWRSPILTFSPLRTHTHKGEGAGVDWSKVNGLMIRTLFSEPNATPNVSLDLIEFYPEPSQAVFMFRFDDALKDGQYDAASYLTSKGMVGTFCALGGGSNDAGEIIQLRAIQNMGHLIANHTYEHLNWDNLTEAQIKSDIGQQAQWLCQNGMPQGARIVVSPAGRWPAQAYPILGDLADFVWLTGDIFGTFYASNVQRAIINTTDTVPAITNLQAAVDNTIADKGIMAVYWHEVTDDTKTQFEALADDVAAHRDAGDINVVTPIQVLNKGDKSRTRYGN